ncbi:sigma-54 dependent transcriptional regulator [Aureimonas sp. AU22]|jgi:two-component system, NtrC family, nitrogen regulation response regulator NtrX|uniref:nitrogen assimilation response regulator NtrX n=1 Tax=Aureimonas sp. AU22 TaxID=1638162 RepID=UPI000705A59A|nr:sigma-54 dependent transcriptional regulator [Aureimonas sp. AU22]BAT30033.1 nitrogen assimilation regulatory protein NTRX [Aureimonas sp. AU22]
MAADILIVDDEADIRELVAGLLDDEGYETRTASNSDMALQAIADRVPRLIFLDIWLQGSRLDGLDVLDAIRAQHPEVPVVMISGHGNIETAVSAIRRGAYDYIEKPFKADRLVLIAERALETSKLKREVSELKRRSSDSPDLLGKSHPMNQLRATIERVAPTNSRVMILGPSGSGKEMVARAIHAASARAKGPFIALNAAAITPERMEVELFGTETPPGVERKVGALEEAHGGVLYLDEVGDMPRETQNKILRVLTEQTFERVGGAKRVKVDVRIISSTSQNLESLMAEGTFREDLFHRLAVVPISVPPLADRRSDIPILIEAFMKQIGDQTGIRAKALSPEALAVLQSSDWPGNIRQLRNNIERLMILSRQDGAEAISADMLPHEVSDMLPRTPSQSDGRILALPLRDAREVFEKEYLVAQINRFGGNISRTAEFVGMERSALHRKLKSLGI